MLIISWALVETRPEDLPGRNLGGELCVAATRCQMNPGGFLGDQVVVSESLPFFWGGTCESYWSHEDCCQWNQIFDLDFENSCFGEFMMPVFLTDHESSFKTGCFSITGDWLGDEITGCQKAAGISGRRLCHSQNLWGLAWQMPNDAIKKELWELVPFGPGTKVLLFWSLHGSLWEWNSTCKWHQKISVMSQLSFSLFFLATQWSWYQRLTQVQTRHRKLTCWPETDSWMAKSQHFLSQKLLIWRWHHGQLDLSCYRLLVWYFGPWMFHIGSSLAQDFSWYLNHSDI